MTILKKGPKCQAWNPATAKAFVKLKTAFTTTSILKHLGPSRPFQLEVNASKSGVGAVFSQHFGGNPKIHPMAFCSQKLPPAEQNFDIGNCKLLAVKLALEEWHYWFEEFSYPFMIFTDHRNFEYWKIAKRLNSHQA